MSEEADRKRRAALRRRTATLRKTVLGATHDTLVSVRDAEAVSLVWVLTQQSWVLSGRPMPTYPRSQIPCRFVRSRR